MKPVISFLLGSGFSIPEGLPGVKQLNERLSKIHESEIMIHSDLRALFLNGQNDPNRHTNWDSRVFLQEFLEFYTSDILKDASQFHYESFYDFYSGYLNNDENKEVIEGFFKKFNERHFSDSENYHDCFNRVNDFNRSYNQLLASLLHKAQYFEDTNSANYPPYDNFIAFLKELLTRYNIKVHTLNHDLFFDWLGHAHVDLWQKFSDGYKLEGSPFYGTVSYDFKGGLDKRPVHKTYHVKLEQFCNEYDKSLCLFKLHGSIFNTIVYPPGNNPPPVRLKANYAVSRFEMEVKNPETEQYSFERLWDEAAPDFLSGTTNKTRYYTGDPYYLNLFKHFETNLSKSEFLFVIGYGFQDAGINEYLEKNFLASGKKMIVINPSKPNTELIDKYSAVHIAKGITELSYEEYFNNL